ncbi:class I adenylate-forming enzyme family protein [Burkholderia gladioli]|uniref:O-succinylbenzoate--CoA ligase n=1 Tax=Burkholderia gladioli (strain BSR3) TaxID=999541 RepID=F2LT71_BURGS|nr:class I adenylate-forming enzyme family protein [Burkholderia gladioli]AEA66017.1 o-succinylbenzoate--CoA ligase [Burkholderia gladioli BSR3]MBW5285049.1 acyl--CoA ligase [Burkholderia gladioli]
MNEAGIVDLVPAALRREWAQRGYYPGLGAFELFRTRALASPDKPAVLTPDSSIGYGELLDAARRLAGGLRARGIVAGDVIAYQLPNSWHACALDLAAAALGAVVAPFPPGRGRLDILALLRRCGARAVVVAPEQGDIDMGALLESLRPTLPALRVLVMDDRARPGWHRFGDLLAGSPIADATLPDVDPDAPLRLLVSSGTESEPKLVAYSHNALIGGRGRFLQRLHPGGASFRGLYLVPLGSSFGSTATFGVLCWLGGSVALLPAFEPRAAIAAIARLRPTHILGVPTMLQRIAAEPALANADKSSLVALVSGGAVVDPATVRRCSAAFACRFVSLYGSADGVNCHNTLDEAPDVPLTTVGTPNPSVCEIRIVDDERRTLPEGEVGEIVARGPMSPMQYVNAPELDARYRDGEGWVYTGDLGYLDTHGRLVLAGRKKDIIIRGGTNISTVQIETLATACPDVVSAACVAVPDADLGQRVCLYLTIRDGAPRPSLADMSGYLRERGLEVNKLPEYLRFVRQLPLTPAGKIDKKQLAAEVAFVGRGAPVSP